MARRPRRRHDHPPHHPHQRRLGRILEKPRPQNPGGSKPNLHQALNQIRRLSVPLWFTPASPGSGCSPWIQRFPAPASGESASATPPLPLAVKSVEQPCHAQRQDAHRHHPRPWPRPALDRRHVGEARLSHDAGLFRALGDRADVLGLQVARLRRREHADSVPRPARPAAAHHGARPLQRRLDRPVGRGQPSHPRRKKF